MNSSIFAKAQQAYEVFARLAALLQSPLLLVMRLYWGWSFFVTGKGKLLNLDKTADYFAGLNLPFPKLNGVLAGSTECFGGLLLLVGLASRLVSIPLAFTMLVAYFTADREALSSIFSDPDKFLGADPFLFLLTAIIVLAFGPGVFSLDWLIARKLRGKSSPA
jgi:putative oxidoreductase